MKLVCIPTYLRMKQLSHALVLMLFLAMLIPYLKHQLNISKIVEFTVKCNYFQFNTQLISPLVGEDMGSEPSPEIGDITFNGSEDKLFLSEHITLQF